MLRLLVMNCVLLRATPVRTAVNAGCEYADVAFVDASRQGQASGVIDFPLLRIYDVTPVCQESQKRDLLEFGSLELRASSAEDSFHRPDPAILSRWPTETPRAVVRSQSRLSCSGDVPRSAFQASLPRSRWMGLG